MLCFDEWRHLSLSSLFFPVLVLDQLPLFQSPSPFFHVFVFLSIMLDLSPFFMTLSFEVILLHSASSV